jgi:hypothetical protein
MKYLLWLFGAFFVGCPLHNPVPVEPDYPDSAVHATCEAACKNIHALSCPEGDEQCVTVCKHANEIRPLPLACWANARSVAEARACGSLRCVR